MPSANIWLYLNVWDVSRISYPKKINHNSWSTHFAMFAFGRICFSQGSCVGGQPPAHAYYRECWGNNCHKVRLMSTRHYNIKLENKLRCWLTNTLILGFKMYRSKVRCVFSMTIVSILRQVELGRETHTPFLFDLLFLNPASINRNIETSRRLSLYVPVGVGLL